MKSYDVYITVIENDRYKFYIQKYMVNRYFGKIDFDKVMLHEQKVFRKLNPKKKILKDHCTIFGFNGATYHKYYGDELMNEFSGEQELLGISGYHK